MGTYNHVQIIVSDLTPDLLSFTTADKILRIRRIPLASYDCDMLNPGGINQIKKFLQITTVMIGVEVDVDKRRPFASLVAFKQWKLPALGLLYYRA
jgi:hypothetical protein